MPGVPQKLTIDIVSDVVCPWCAIGYKGLEHALRPGDRAEATVSWHPFELPIICPQAANPGVCANVMAPAASQKSRQGRGYGAAVGLDFRYSEGSRIYNSFRRINCPLGRRQSSNQALFKAYF
jgi:predicted DsbA family dithiol-disulfide isomerase